MNVSQIINSLYNWEIFSRESMLLFGLDMLVVIEKIIHFMNVVLSTENIYLLKKLKCGHSCIGFCGEPCPPLCRIFNPEITEILFGREDEPNAAR